MLLTKNGNFVIHAIDQKWNVPEMYPGILPQQWDMRPHCHDDVPQLKKVQIYRIYRCHDDGIYLTPVAMTTGYIRYIHLWFPLISSVKVVYSSIYTRNNSSVHYTPTRVEGVTHAVLDIFCSYYLLAMFSCYVVKFMTVAIIQHLITLTTACYTIKKYCLANTTSTIISAAHALAMCKIRTFIVC